MKHKLPRNYLVALAAMTAFCLLALFIRNKVSGGVPGSPDLDFLLWNLFLAFVPLPLAWLSHFLLGRAAKFIVVLATLGWLLFYPNAPYMISDVIHVNKDSQNLLLYDGLMIFMFAMLALFYGFYSLKIIHLVYRTITGKKTANIIIAFCILLSSAGIYLGRILRLNSWDFFTRPLQVMKDIFAHLFPVNENPSTYLVVLFFSFIQFILLVMMKDLDEIERDQLISGEQAGAVRVIKTNKASVQ